MSLGWTDELRSMFVEEYLSNLGGGGLEVTFPVKFKGLIVEFQLYSDRCTVDPVRVYILQTTKSLVRDRVRQKCERLTSG